MPSVQQNGDVLRLPLDLLLRVLEPCTGLELHTCEAVCAEWRGALQAHGDGLYRAACRAEFAAAAPAVAAPSCGSSSSKDGGWKQAYAQAYVKAKVDRLYSCQTACSQLEGRLEDLDDLLQQATSVRRQLTDVLAAGDPDPLFLIVADMEQDCMEKRHEARQELLFTQVELEALQDEVAILRTRMPALAAA